jgi:NAD+ kinase
MHIVTYIESDAMKKILIVPNPSKDPSFMITQRVIAWFNSKNVQIFMPSEYRHHHGFSHLCIPDEQLYELDYAIILGGDGTIISTSRKYVDFDIPLLGINLGNLGFLAEIELSELEEALQAFINDEFIVEERMMVAATVQNHKDIGRALNDIVITRQSISRIISYDVYVNDAYMNTYRADGIIISTPTGSTAYNLSAGGPIITPNNEVVILTPICPHSLTARSIVLSGEDIIDIRFDQPRNKHVNDLLVTVDGQEVTRVNTTDIIRIGKASKKVKLMRLCNNDFFEILRRKLS